MLERKYLDPEKAAIRRDRNTAGQAVVAGDNRLYGIKKKERPTGGHSCSKRSSAGSLGCGCWLSAIDCRCPAVVCDIEASALENDRRGGVLAPDAPVAGRAADLGPGLTEGESGLKDPSTGNTGIIVARHAGFSSARGLVSLEPDPDRFRPGDLRSGQPDGQDAILETGPGAVATRRRCAFVRIGLRQSY